MRAPGPRRAMTMVELMVVFATLAVLLGLLWPALSTVSSAGRSTQCRARLRQMTIAAQSYAAIYDVFPVAIRYEAVDGVMQQVAWDWVTTPGGALISPGPLWRLTNIPGEVQQCPAYTGSANFAGDPYTGYNYNTSYIGGEAPFPQTGWDAVRWGVRPHACRRASQTAIFGDAGYAAGAQKFMRAPLNREGQNLDMIYSGGQAFRHARSTNVAYVDGHVGSVYHPYPGDLATEELLAEEMGYPKNGFLSNDDGAYDPR